MPGMIPVASNPAAVQINQRLGFLADGRFGFHGKIADAATSESAGGQVPVRDRLGSSRLFRSGNGDQYAGERGPCRVGTHPRLPDVAPRSIFFQTPLKNSRFALTPTRRGGIGPRASRSGLKTRRHRRPAQVARDKDDVGLGDDAPRAAHRLFHADCRTAFSGPRESSAASAHAAAVISESVRIPSHL